MLSSRLLIASFAAVGTLLALACCGGSGSDAPPAQAIDPAAGDPDAASSSDDASSRPDAGKLGDGGGDAGACKPATCASLHATCGAPAGGCGKPLACGTCAAPTSCTASYVCDVSADSLTATWTSPNALSPTTLAWVTSLAWRPDGSRVAAAGGLVGSLGGTLVIVDGRAVTLDAATGAAAPIATLAPQHATSLAFAPSGTRLAIGTATGDGLYLYDVDPAGAIAAAADSPGCRVGGVNGVAWKPDGSRVVAGNSGSFDAFGYPLVCMWQIAPFLETRKQEPTAYAIADVTYDAAGSTVVAALGTTNAIAAFDGATLAAGKIVAIPGASGDAMGHITPVPGKPRVLAAVGANVWSVDYVLGTALPWLATSSVITAIAYHPTLAKVATAHVDQTVRIWDLVTKTTELSVTHGDGVDALAWSPDGTHLASGGKTPGVILWTLALK